MFSQFEHLEDRLLLAGNTSIVPVSVSSGGSHTGDDASGGGSVSADGRYTVFTSESTNLVTGQIDDANTSDVFLYDQVTGAVTLVSHANGTANASANGGSDFAVISADGNFVVYRSLATNLVADQLDGNGGKDLFLFDREHGTTILISRSEGSNTTTGNDGSGRSGFSQDGNSAISADGRFVAFVSTASDLIADMNGGGSNVFLFDSLNNSMRLVSHSSDSATTAGNGFSLTPVLSADGRFVAYTSGATDLVTGQVDDNSLLGGWDVFLFDRDQVQAATALVSGVGGSATVTGDASTFILRAARNEVLARRWCFGMMGVGV